jgi:hypothetical protein
VKYRAALALIIAVLFQALVAVADPPGPPGFPTPAPVTSAAPSPAPTPDPGQWNVNRTAIGQILDQLASRMFGIFIKFTDKSVQLAQTLFMALAALELGWTLIRWMVSQVPLEEYVANSFFKIVQMALLYIVISNSYSSPFGPGWFMMIVNGIVGMAQDTAGVNVVGTSDTGQFTPVITPGTIIDIGLRLFVMIMTGASQGVNGWNLLAGLTTGATLIYFGTWLFCLCSAVGAVCTMAWIAYRWLWITMKALWLGTMMFMTGFTGSRVTSSIGFGPFNGAFNVGIEMAAHVVIIGLFYPIITSYAGSIGFAQAMEGVPGYGGPAAPLPVGHIGAMVIEIGAVLLLDLGLALWTFAIKHAPDLAQFAISGSIRMNERDALGGMKSESGVLQAGSTVARVGAGVVAGATGGGGGEGQPSGEDRMQGAASGAVRGLLMAGPEGALAGAVAGAATAKSSKPQGGDGGSVRGGEGEGAAPQGEGAASGSFTGGFVDLAASKKKGSSEAAGRGDAESPGQTGSAASGDGAASAGVDAADGEGAAADGARRARTVRAGGTDVRVERQGDRVTESGSVGGADAAGASDDAGEAQQGYEGQGGGSRTGTRRGARVLEAGVPTAPGAAGASAATSTGGIAAGPPPAGAGVATSASDPTAAPNAAIGARAQSRGAGGVSQGNRATIGGGEAGSASELAAALRENTAALRAHRFGGAPGGGGNGSSGGGGGAGSSGGAQSPGAEGGPFGALLGGGNPMNPMNMLLYRQLLMAGRREKPHITNERPAVSLGVSHIE